MQWHGKRIKVKPKAKPKAKSTRRGAARKRKRESHPSWTPEVRKLYSEVKKLAKVVDRAEAAYGKADWMDKPKRAAYNAYRKAKSVFNKKYRKFDAAWSKMPKKKKPVKRKKS